MALWKPFRGNRSDLDSVAKHDGYVYFCIDDATLFFDYEDSNGVLQRKQINANDAQTLTGMSLDEIKEQLSSEVSSIAVEEYLDISNGYYGQITQEMLDYGLYFKLADGVSSSSWEYYCYAADFWGEIYVTGDEIYHLEFNNPNLMVGMEFCLIPFAGNYGDLVCYYSTTKTIEDMYEDITNKADKMTFSTSLDSYIVDGNFNYTLKDQNEKIIFYQWGWEDFIIGEYDYIMVGGAQIPVSELTSTKDQSGPGEEYTEYVFPDCLPDQSLWGWEWNKGSYISMTVGYLCTSKSVIEGLNLNWVYDQIPKGKDASYVLYQKEQKLTEGEKVQARANISAAAQQFKSDYDQMEVGDTTTKGFRWIGGADESILPSYTTGNADLLEIFKFTINGVEHQFGFMPDSWFEDNASCFYVGGSYVMADEYTPLQQGFFPEQPWMQNLDMSGDSVITNTYWDVDYMGSSYPEEITITEISDWAKPYLEIYKQVPVDYIPAPEITAEDDGKILKVENGEFKLVENNIVEANAVNSTELNQMLEEVLV